MMLTGQQPYLEENVAKLVQDIQILEPDYSEDLFRGVSKDGLELIQLMLTKNPEARPSADECLHHKWIKGRSSDVSRNISVESFRAYKDFQPSLEDTS